METNNLSELLRRVQADHSARSVKHTEQMQQMANAWTEEAERVQLLVNMLPDIEGALNKLGLTMRDIRYHRTSSGSDGWVRDVDKLRVCFTACIKPKSKFRFLTFAGYAKEGGGRNYKRLQAKARAMEEAIYVVAGAKVQCSAQSLEVRNAGETKFVLFEMWL